MSSEMFQPDPSKQVVVVESEVTAKAAVRAKALTMAVEYHKEKDEREERWFPSSQSEILRTAESYAKFLLK